MIRRPAVVGGVPRVVLAWAISICVIAWPQRALGDACLGISGTSGGHTICVTRPGASLSGDQSISVTNSPNTGLVFFTWVPNVGKSTYLMEDFAPSPETGDYSFIWPTQKYLDGSGVLRVQAVSTASSPVDVPLTLANTNSRDIQHTANDWQNYLPGPWRQPADPVIVAVGDGPSDETSSNAVSSVIAGINPPLFLFLGDIYQKGSYTEDLNHYGVSALDSPPGTSWGATATVTQPTLGNHEGSNFKAWTDYFHQRPAWTSFTFGGVLFLDLDSQKPLDAGNPQYTFVQNALVGAPRCVVAFWHIPILKGNGVNSSMLAMWSLLASNGGDLVLGGHYHTMVEYAPLNASLNPGSGAHMVQLVNGAGGHGGGGTTTGTRVMWSKGHTPGITLLALNGAANGNAAAAIGWTYEDTTGAVLRTGSVTC